MKNKAILKRKCTEIALYTANIFIWGKKQCLQNILLLFNTNEKVFHFIFLDQKSSM